MKDLTEYQLRHLAVVTNRLAAMDGRALFAAMQEPRLKLGKGLCKRAENRMQLYAFVMQDIRAELARRGLS